MKHRQVTGATLIIVLAGCAAGTTLLAGPGTVGRVIGGVALSLVLPWVAAVRLPAIRHDTSPARRLAVAGSLAFSTIILVGLFLLFTKLGFDTTDLVCAMLLIIVVMALAGIPIAARTPRSTPSIPSFSFVGSALIVLAVCITAAAFFISRHAALLQAKENRPYAAFVVKSHRHFRIGLSNPTDRNARFIVRLIKDGHSDRTIAEVARTGQRIIPLPNRPDPALTRSNPEAHAGRHHPIEIRVSVVSQGRQQGPTLRLFYIPSA